MSFLHPQRDPATVALPAELAVLMAGVVARQAASPTAIVQARLETVASGALAGAPAGAFNGAVAAALTAWKEA